MRPIVHTKYILFFAAFVLCLGCGHRKKRLTYQKLQNNSVNIMPAKQAVSRSLNNANQCLKAKKYFSSEFKARTPLPTTNTSTTFEHGDLVDVHGVVVKRVQRHYQPRFRQDVFYTYHNGLKINSSPEKVIPILSTKCHPKLNCCSFKLGSKIRIIGIMQNGLLKIIKWHSLD